MNPEEQERKLTQEELDVLVSTFKILFDMDRKQNPHLYTKASDGSPKTTEL